MRDHCCFMLRALDCNGGSVWAGGACGVKIVCDGLQSYVHNPHNSILKDRLESNLLDWCDKCGNSFMMPACIQSLQVRKHKPWSDTQRSLSVHPPSDACRPYRPRPTVQTTSNLIGVHVPLPPPQKKRPHHKT